MTERNPWTLSGFASITAEADYDLLGWDAIHPFQVKQTTDRRAGDKVVSGVQRFLQTYGVTDAINATVTAVPELETAG